MELEQLRMANMELHELLLVLGGGNGCVYAAIYSDAAMEEKGDSFVWQPQVNSVFDA